MYRIEIVNGNEQLVRVIAVPMINQLAVAAV
jgi:hypothetical protein